MTTSQASTFVFDPEVHPRRLNLGCGFDLREGYLNVDLQDFHGPDLVGDVRDLAMLPSDTFDEIFAFDVLEHLPRSDTAKALDEWARLLRPGGTLRLETSDVAACGRILAEQDDEAAHHQLLGQLFGTQGYTGDFHLAGFTDLTLAGLLDRAGFRRTMITTRDRWLLTSVSELADDTPADPLTIGWLAGFWGPEYSAAGSWRWCDRRAELLLVNHSDRTLTVDLSAGIGRSLGDAAEVRVWCGAWGALLNDLVQVPDVGEVPWSRTIRIEPGPTRIVFSTTAARLDVPDVRPLAFRLADPTIRVRQETSAGSGAGAARK